jgi:hypothetical protein
VPDKKLRRKLQDPKVVRQLAAALVAGATLSEALKRVGVSESTYYRELRRSPDLPGALGRTRPGEALSPEETGETSGSTGKRGGGGQAKDAKRPASRKRGTSRRAAADPAEADTDQAADAAPKKHAAPKKSKRAKRGATTQKAPRISWRQAAPSSTTGAGGATPALPPHAPSAPSSGSPAATVTAVAVSIESPGAISDSPPAAPPVTERPRLSRLVRNPYTIEGATATAMKQRVAPRSSTPALSGADWMPPIIVLLLQLVVAVAVGASLLVIGLITLTCLILFVIIRRARTVVAAPSPDAQILSVATEGESDEDQRKEEDRAMDLRWVASTILPSRKPPNDRRLPPRGG